MTVKHIRSFIEVPPTVPHLRYVEGKIWDLKAVTSTKGEADLVAKGLRKAQVIEQLPKKYGKKVYRQSARVFPISEKNAAPNRRYAVYSWNPGTGGTY
ncbi:MAG: hypothetical protein WC262_11610 [Bacteroidales bacterium]|jgi:hypothetical protein